MDEEADIEAVADRGEHVALGGPLVIGASNRKRGELADRGVELLRKSVGFYRSLPPSLMQSLAGLVRAMNCYYSNFDRGSRHSSDRHRTGPA